MKIEAILGLVMAEIDRAEKLHPVWPADLVKYILYESTRPIDIWEQSVIKTFVYIRQTKLVIV